MRSAPTEFRDAGRGTSIGDARARTVRPLHLCLLFGVLVSFYAASFQPRGITDTHLNHLQTRALVRHGDVDLARYQPASGYVIREDGHVYSIYGVGISLVAAPVYATFDRLDLGESTMQGLVAVPIVAAAVLIMFTLLLRLVPPSIAAGAAIAFAFGTAMWPIAASALFHHGPVVLFEAIGLTGLFSRKPRAPAVAGFGFAAATLVRPTAAIALLVVGIFHLLQGRRATAVYAAGAAAPLIGIVVQNRWIWGSWLTGGYSRTGPGFNGSIPDNSFELLFGWWRGLFVYSPVLILAVAGWILAVRNRKGFVESRLVFLGISSVATLLLYSKWSAWSAGLHQFGYRFLLDCVPFLVVLGAWAVAERRRLQVVAIPLAVISIMTMAFGMAQSRFAWDGMMFPETMTDAPIGEAWVVFLDHPKGGIVRLIGVAAVASIFTLVARGASRNQAAGLLDPGVARIKRSGRRPAAAPD